MTLGTLAAFALTSVAMVRLRADSPAVSIVPAGLECLAKVYGGRTVPAAPKERSDLSRFLILSNDTRILWDDHIDKSFDEKLARPDLEDTLSIPYPLTDNYLPLSINFDPGRFRSMALLKAVYGDTQSDVKKNLTSITWAPSGKKIRFNRQLGAAAALQQVGKQLAGMNGVTRYVKNLGGTFNWRVIKDTNRLSPHSFGIAVDINTTFSDYWKWAAPGLDPLPYRNRIPMSVVRAFERNGFIWGGKWYHYDTMHFEYRPEFFCTSDEK